MSQKKQVRNAEEIQKGQEFPLTIKRLGINGEGIGYYKRKAVFVQGVLPGEEIVASVITNHSKYIQGELKKIRKPSKDRIKAPCPIYEPCGGCQLQHLRYEKQLEFKRDLILQAFERYVKRNINPELIKPTIGMEHPWDYRNKSQMQVGKKKGEVIAGLYGTGSHELIDATDCLVQHPKTNAVPRKVKRIIQDLNIPVYNERKNEGIIRTIVTRVAMETEQIQLVLITTKQDFPKKELLIDEIQKRIPEIDSLILNVNDKKTSLIFGDKTFPLVGDAYIEEKLEGIGFELSARAFFQLNPTQTVKLYNEVKRVAALTGKEKLVDAYCGVGTIGLWLAEDAKEVRGIEVIKEAVEDARKNAKRLGYSNASYETGRAEELLPKWQKEGFRPDVIIVDPPRTGLDHKFIETLKKIKPKKFIYVSCNPSTLAKDIDALGKDFEVKSVQPVDMFPQTSQVECVAQLKLK